MAAPVKPNALPWLLAVATTNEAPDLQHPGQVAAVLAELKEFARRTENRQLIRDRRRIHDARTAWALREQKGE